MTVARIRALTKKPQRLQVIADGLLPQVARAMNVHAEGAVTELQIYPPPVPNTRYVRTYHLQQSWSVTPAHLTAEGLVGNIRNDAGYAGLVVGDEQGRGQLPMHGTKRRGPPWPLQAEVLRRGYRAAIARAVKKVVA